MAPQRTEGLITIENARIIYPNFSGTEKEYNREGDRNFCVLIPDPMVAEQMARDNYNIKTKQPYVPEGEEREEGVEGQPFLQVKISYKGRKPEIYLIGERSRSKTALTEDVLDLLDSVEIVTADLQISPYNWKPGRVTAYLRKMFVVQAEDSLDMKWAGILGEPS